MNYQLRLANSSIFGKIDLSASKSISNRLLIISALSENTFRIKNLSKSNDTKIMQRALASLSKIVDVEDAGTCMRFLTAYFALLKRKIQLRCSEGMRKRPIATLVNALNSIGANIAYIEKNGYPPLQINPAELAGNVLELKGSISSQFITALLLIAPKLENGLTLHITGKIVSEPYIQMTIDLMKKFNVEVHFADNLISVNPQNYIPVFKSFIVEPDWSAASYWYAMLALADKGKLLLKGLKHSSIQGDARQVKIFRELGVATSFTKAGAILEKKSVETKHLTIDFSPMPDLVQTFAVCCVCLNIPFAFKGVETLRIKETNRVEALISELRKFGYKLYSPAIGELKWDGEKTPLQKNIEIETYTDHRMAMAFAPMVFHFKSIKIKNIKVVRKSYPDFWLHLQNIGVSCKPYG